MFRSFSPSTSVYHLGGSLLRFCSPPRQRKLRSAKLAANGRPTRRLSPRSILDSATNTRRRKLWRVCRRRMSFKGRTWTTRNSSPNLQNSSPAYKTRRRSLYLEEKLGRRTQQMERKLRSPHPTSCKLLGKRSFLDFRVVRSLSGCWTVGREMHSPFPPPLSLSIHPLLHPPPRAAAPYPFATSSHIYGTLQHTPSAMRVCSASIFLSNKAQAVWGKNSLPANQRQRSARSCLPQRRTANRIL